MSGGALRIDLPGRVQLRVTGRAYPGGRRPFDHDWLHAELVVAAGETQRGFRCSAFLRAESFGAFAAECADQAIDPVRYAPVEPFVVLEIGGGHAAITARDIGTQHVVRRTDLIDGVGRARLAQQFAAVASRYPPRGAID